MTSPFLQASCGCTYLRVEYGIQVLVEHCKWTDDGPQLVFAELLTPSHHREDLRVLNEAEHRSLVDRINRACLQAYQFQRIVDVVGPAVGWLEEEGKI